MIKVETQRENGRMVGLTMKGHDHPSVCAAASALVQSAMMGLKVVAGANLDIQQVNSGYIAFRLESDPTEKTDAILETMLLGLKEVRVE